MDNKPLQDIMILDLTRVLAGPFATRIAADLGARVIKIEPPLNGDDTRAYGPFIKDFSAYFLSLNHGKESIQLNLKNPDDRMIFQGLCQHADVVIENYRAGTMDKLGYGWEFFEQNFPHIIYCAISGFGQSGPYADRPAYDMVVQAMGGLMSITGEEGGEPVRVGTSIGDITAALFASTAIASCLYRRTRSGKGSYIDISMLDCQISILENALVRYSAKGEIPVPLGSRHATISPFGAFKARDQRIIIAIGNDHLFGVFCQLLNAQYLQDNPHYQTNQARSMHINALTQEIEKILQTNNADYWLELLEHHGVPASPINNIAQVFQDPQIAARNMIIQVDDPELGSLKVAGNPIKINGCLNDTHAAPAPRLNQHREQILTEFNLGGAKK